MGLHGGVTFCNKTATFHGEVGDKEDWARNNQDICRPEKDGKQSGFTSHRNLWFNLLTDLTFLQLGRPTGFTSSIHHAYIYICIHIYTHIDNTENSHRTTESFTATKSKGILKSLMLNRNCRHADVKSFPLYVAYLLHIFIQENYP